MMGENLKVVIFEVSALSKAIDVYLQMSMVAFFVVMYVLHCTLACLHLELKNSAHILSLAEHSETLFIHNLRTFVVS